MDSIDRFLLFFVTPTVFALSLLEAVVLARRIATTGVPSVHRVRPGGAHRGGHLAAAVDRHALHRLGSDASGFEFHARWPAGVADPLCGSGVLLLLVPPRGASRALVLVQPLGAPLAQRTQPVGGLPHRHGRQAHRHAVVLLAADVAGLLATARAAGADVQPAVPVLAAHHLGAQARLARGHRQHAVGAPRAPRLEPRVPRHQLRRRADGVRPPVRYLSRRAQ